MLVDIRSQKDRDLVTLTGAYTHPVVGLTSGCFDLFHSLHLTYLQKCRRMCDVLIVGVDSDDWIRERKGVGRPIIPEHQRVMLVNALECVNVAFIMGSLQDWEIACEWFSPNKLFKNSDFRPEDVVRFSKEQEVVIIPDVLQFESTTQIIKEIQNAHERRQ